MTFRLNLQPDMLALQAGHTPQVCYVLLDIAASAAGSTPPPINWALVADASASMRIPIVSDEQFRQLVRAGSAEEVLVDGVPVWQFTTPVPPAIKQAAPSALAYVGRAVQSVVEWLDSADRFSLVACAEDAVVLVSAVSGAQRGAVVQGIQRLSELDLGSETSLGQGLQLAWDELVRGRASSTGAPLVERVLLLTDGFTRKPETCLHLARQLATEGITITTLGLGGDFHEDVLTALADVGGGQALFLHTPETIPHAIEQELVAARAVAVRAVTLQLHCIGGVVLRRVTRMQPALTLLEPVPTTPTSMVLHLGDLMRHTQITLLLELRVPPGVAGRLVQCVVHGSTGPQSHTAHADIVAHARAEVPPLPPALLDAITRANAAHLQQRAIAASAQGDYIRAAQCFRQVAARFTAQGEAHLAAAALREAQSLEQERQTTRLGVKELTYATRRQEHMEQARTAAPDRKR